MKVIPFIKFNRKSALLTCIVITVVVMIIEFILSHITRSLMLYSDGLHMLSHGLALGVAFVAIKLAEKRKSVRIENIAALINGIGLFFFTIIIFADALRAMANPDSILVKETLIVSVIGLITNLVTAWILFSSGIEDINTKGAFLHMLADTFSSVSIIIGVLVIHYTHWFIIDALLSIVIGLVIGKWAIGLIIDSARLLSREKETLETRTSGLQ